MESINVLVTKPFSKSLIEKLTNVSPRLNITQHVAVLPEDLPEDLSPYHVIYASRAIPNPADAPNLRWLQLHAAGADRLLQHPLYTESDITLTTTSGIHATNIAEYVIAQILAFAHHLPRMFDDKKGRNWPDGLWDLYVPRELRGSTLGLVGYGNIARETARLASAFGMKVLALKRNVRKLVEVNPIAPDELGDPEADIPDRIYPPTALKSFLSACDYVVLTVPLTPQTHHLIDAAALEAMQPHAVLVNIARGDVVDEGALIEALREEKIAGAALDVFHQEPLPEDSPLWELPNVIISPHVSGFTPHYDERATDLFAENLRRFVSGEPLLNVIDRGRNY